MSRNKTARHKLKGTSRREFCRAAGLTTCLAALGAWTVENLWGAEGGGQGLAASAAPAPKSTKENQMEKKIQSVTAKVLSVKGSCWQKVGDAATFSETGVDGKICIHAMYSMLPKVFAMMYGARFPWLQNPDVAVHACPDPNNPVVFEITRNYAE